MTAALALELVSKRQKTPPPIPAEGTDDGATRIERGGGAFSTGNSISKLHIRPARTGREITPVELPGIT